MHRYKMYVCTSACVRVYVYVCVYDAYKKNLMHKTASCRCRRDRVRDRLCPPCGGDSARSCEDRARARALRAGRERGGMYGVPSDKIAETRIEREKEEDTISPASSR